MLNKNYKEAMVETLDIIYHSTPKVINKIPKEVIDFMEENKSLTYEIKLDHKKRIKDMKIKKETKILISRIYSKYILNNKK